MEVQDIYELVVFEDTETNKYIVEGCWLMNMEKTEASTIMIQLVPIITGWRETTETIKVDRSNENWEFPVVPGMIGDIQFGVISGPLFDGATNDNGPDN